MNFFCKFPNNFLVFSGFPYNSFSINDAEQVSDIAKVVNMCIYMEFVWHKVLYLEYKQEQCHSCNILLIFTLCNIFVLLLTITCCTKWHALYAKVAYLKDSYVDNMKLN